MAERGVKNAITDRVIIRRRTCCAGSRPDQYSMPSSARWSRAARALREDAQMRTSAATENTEAAAVGGPSPTALSRPTPAGETLNAEFVEENARLRKHKTAGRRRGAPTSASNRAACCLTRCSER